MGDCNNLADVVFNGQEETSRTWSVSKQELRNGKDGIVRYAGDAWWDEGVKLHPFDRP